MIYLIFLNIFTSLWGKFGEIARVNDLKSEGEKAYIERNYTKAIIKYKTLLFQYHNTDESVRMNLAHAFFKNNDTINAIFHYKKLVNSSNSKLSSIANHQLGVICAFQNQNKKALNYFKEAIKADPSNESARFNYELIVKKQEDKEGKESSEKEKNEGTSYQNTGNEHHNHSENSNENKKTITSEKKDPEGNIQGEIDSSTSENEGEGKEKKNKSDRNSDSEDQENFSHEELELNKKGNKQREALISRRLKKINMTKEKARMILEAMKNTEIQYLQQIKKTGSPDYDKGKPDW